jgi:putative DNA primase/helicase
MSAAATVAEALGGHKTGSGWIARCPAHDDRSPSLSVGCADDGKVLVHCHAGCKQAEVISALRLRGLWDQRKIRSFNHAAPRVAAIDWPDRDDQKRTERALGIWQSSTSAKNPLVETYLASRGLHIPPPPTLRFHPGLKHPSGTIWPAMVALVTRGSDGAPIAIHRTFIARDGAGKAPVDPQKMMLGPCRGGGVLLGTPSDILMTGEGAAFRVAAVRWQREERRVRFARPPRGFDFNDVLLGRTSPQAKDTP